MLAAISSAATAIPSLTSSPGLLLRLGQRLFPLHSPFSPLLSGPVLTCQISPDRGAIFPGRTVWRLGRHCARHYQRVAARYPLRAQAPERFHAVPVLARPLQPGRVSLARHFDQLCALLASCCSITHHYFIFCSLFFFPFLVSLSQVPQVLQLLGGSQQRAGSEEPNLQGQSLVAEEYDAALLCQ